MNRRKKIVIVYLIVIMLFTLIAVAYTRPLVGKAGDHVLGNSGDLLLNIYIISWTSRTLGSNPLNLFNTTMFYPNSNTLAYTDHQILNSLMALPVLAVTHNQVFAYNFLVILTFILGALGGFLLVDHLVHDKLAAFVGGIIFVLPMYKLAHIEHTNLLATWPIPLAFLFLHLYTEKKKPLYAFLFSVFTIAVFLSAWSYGFFFAFAVFIYLVALGIVKRRKVKEVLLRRVDVRERRSVYRWVVVLVAAFLLIIMAVIPFAVPYLKVSKQDPDFQRRIHDVDVFSADVRDYVTAPPTNWAWGAITRPFREGTDRPSGPPERALFPGLLPLLLALGGLVYLIKKRTPKNRFTLAFYVSLLVISAILSFGISFYFFGRHYDFYMPYRLLYHFFPGFKSVRTPTRMIILVLLAMAVLGGFGVKWLREKLRGRLSKRVALLIVVALLVLLTGEMMSHNIPTPLVPSSKAEWPAVYRWMATREGDAPTVVLPLGTINTLSATQLEPWRVYYNTANWKKMVNGYSGYTPKSYLEAMVATSGFPSETSLEFLRNLKVEYVIVEGDKYDRLTVEKTLDWAKQDSRFHLEKVFDHDYVFQLR